VIGLSESHQQDRAQSVQRPANLDGEHVPATEGWPEGGRQAGEQHGHLQAVTHHVGQRIVGPEHQVIDQREADAGADGDKQEDPYPVNGVGEPLRAELPFQRLGKLQGRETLGAQSGQEHIAAAAVGGVIHQSIVGRRPVRSKRDGRSCWPPC
jgi:hypothetical protein